MERTDPQTLRAARSFATSQLRMGRSPQEVEEALLHRGVDFEDARELLRSARAPRNAERLPPAGPSWAVRNMLIGGAIFAIGLPVTLGTYVLADSNPEGGHFILAFGPIIVGAGQFLAGLGQSMRARR